MHILFHSLKFLKILYIGRSFIKIMYKGFHIFIEKIGHFTKNLSNDTEKHVPNSKRQLTATFDDTTAAAALSQVTAKPFDPYASSQNFYSFFSWQPLERPLPNFNAEILR